MLLAKEAEARASSAKFLPAFFVEPLERGETIATDALPPHIALYQEVNMLYRPKMDELVRFAVRDITPHKIELAERTYDDTNGSSAFRVMGSLSLSMTYRSLFTILQSFSRETVQPFRPKIVVPQGPSQLHEDQYLSVNSITVIETYAQTPGWEVVDVIPLRGKV
jgi:hypothetical protein